MLSKSEQTYYEIFAEKFSKCESKKDYKKLCKMMLKQFDVIDRVDANQWRIFSSLIGSDMYSYGIAMAIKMYILEQQGIPVDIVSIVKSPETQAKP